MAVLDGASPQQGTVCWTLVTKPSDTVCREPAVPKAREELYPSTMPRPVPYTPDSLGFLAITPGKLAPRTQGRQ